MEIWGDGKENGIVRFRRFLSPRFWICHYLLHFHFVLSLWILSLYILSFRATSAGSRLLFTEKPYNFYTIIFFNLRRNNSWKLWTLELDHFANWATCRNCINWLIEKNQLLTDSLTDIMTTWNQEKLAHLKRSTDLMAKIQQSWLKKYYVVLVKFLIENVTIWYYYWKGLLMVLCYTMIVLKLYCSASPGERGGKPPQQV